MPRNGSGVYSPPAANYPAVTGTTITAANRNAVDADIATALTGSVAVNGESVITANLPMAGFKLTGLGAGASNGDSLRYQQLFTTSAVTLLGALNMVKGADIASASTIDLTAATGNAVHVTGTTTITAVTLGSGMWRLVIFDAALTLTHHATNNNLPGGVDIVTAAGDRAIYWSDGTTVYCVSFAAQQTTQSVYSTHLSGMRVTNDGTDATNDIDIAAGVCRDSTDTIYIVQPSALVKRLDADWAAGTNQGMRNSAAAITNTTYHIHAVCKARGADPDYYAHTSASEATALAALQAETGGSAYIYARRIFSIVRTGGAIYPFLQTGDRVMWVTPVIDVSAAANTSPTTRTLTLPTGIKVEAILGVVAFATGQNLTFVYDPDLGSLSAGSANFNLFNETNLNAACQIRCMTNTSAQVNSDGNGTGATITISTQGFIDTRGRTE